MGFGFHHINSEIQHSDSVFLGYHDQEWPRNQRECLFLWHKRCERRDGCGCTGPSTSLDLTAGHEAKQEMWDRRHLSAWEFVSRWGISLTTGVVLTCNSSACIAAIVRIPLVAEYKYWDITYTIASAGIWIAVECNIGIVSACFPVMWPLLKKTPRPPYPISINSLRSLSIDIRRKKSNSITTFSGLNPPRSDRSTECQLREGASTKLSARAGTNIPYTIPKVWEVTSSLKVHDVAAMSEKESARKSIKEGDRKISWSVGRSNKDDIV